jgi:hypothetical protein
VLLFWLIAHEGAGVFTEGVKAEFRDFIKSLFSMQRMGTMDDAANAAGYLALHPCFPMRGPGGSKRSAKAY